MWTDEQLETPIPVEAEVTAGILAKLPASYSEQRWYAAYTCPRHEKRVAEQLRHRYVEFFLPLYQTVHRWKDRRKRVELPLFPSYVFVRVALKDRLRVLEIPSVVRFVGFNGHPAPLPENEIETLRSGFAQQLRVEPHTYLNIGQRVHIKNGPLKGMEGILVRGKSRYRVVLSIDLIMRSASVEIDLADIERAS